MVSDHKDLYRRLQRHLDRMPIGFPATESGVEIRILQRLFTPEEAAIALELSAVPEPAATIHRRIGARKTLADLTLELDAMGRKGIILGIPSPGGRLYGKSIFAIGMYEWQVNRLTPELERDSRQYMDEAFGAAFHSLKTTQLRTVPVNKAISTARNVATHDNLRAYVESSPGPFAKMKCICRHGRDLVEHKCRQTSLRENCLTIGMGAQMVTDTGLGRAISKEEMLELLETADKEGLVLQPENTKNPIFVCCCCGCCCAVLTSAKRFPRPADYFNAGFEAIADAETCEVCGVCETRCQMEAISMASGKASVDAARCIGCALCITTCPSGALRLEARPERATPPDDRKALYMQILQDRYGPWGMAKIGARKLLGMKI